jgi:hypothetical protein
MEERNRITTEYGNKLLAIAKEKPKGERKRYIGVARKYLKQSDIDAEFPPSWLEDCF